MGVCPKCKKPVDDQAANCPACGAQLPAASGGTLDVDAHFEGDAPPKKGKSSGKAKKPRSGEPTAEDAQGTLNLPDEDSASPADATHLEETIDSVAMPADLRAAVTNAEQGPTLEETIDSVDAPDDRQGTVVLPNSQSAPAHGTHEYGDEDIKWAQGKSGTAGRLKRLWGGAAGSSANPMHTLKGEEALATDSVFARVAQRVLVTDTAIEIADSVGTASASQPERRARVKECITIACEGGDFETADYDLTGFLGQGGMGVVLKARQKAIGRDVAIKMIQPMSGKSGRSASSTLAQQKKFFYEAQITGKLDHPNIVPIYELGISNQVLFYSMKMIVGTEWKDVIKSKSRDDNLDILMKVADAMAFAHQRQIIHRDLKPENVMLGAFGEVLVTDWGCAVDLARNERFGGAGSPPWMAPEMADHDLRKIGPKSDIYLLGAMLYQIIAGYPPHPGRTVFECIQNAQKNVILPLEIEDPLLDIALRAMETEPDDRFPTVEAMQVAIREYRRHAESITLTERSEALYEQAVASKDYARFSRTIFGFQDAVELWPGNSAAISGLAAARLAYGQCAFDKGDYDLCLQALDAGVPAEAELYRRAEKAKREADGRGARIKTLRRLVAAVVLIGLGVSSVAAGVATVQWRQAVASAKAEEEAKNIAIEEQEKALESARLEAEAKEAALIAQGKAERAQAAAEESARLEEEAKMAALVAKGEAEDAQMAAERSAKLEAEAKDDAIRLQGVAEERLAQIELSAYQSQLALSLSRVRQQDVASADAAIEQLVSEESYQALRDRKELPKFDNWALKRVNLLSNRELLGEPLREQVVVTAAGFARDANRGVIATQGPNGNELHLVHLQGKKLVAESGLTTEAPVIALSVSPDGREVVYSLAPDALRTPDDDEEPSTVFKWQIGSPEAEEISQAGQRWMQDFEMSDSKVVAGINGGIWVWTRNDQGWQTTEPKQLRKVGGELRSLQLLDGDRALALAIRNGQANVYLLDLSQQGARETSGLLNLAADADSEFGNERVTAAAVAKNKLILGTATGNLFTVDIDMSAANARLGSEFRRILPQQHRSAIRSIRVHEDGTLLTTAEEAVANVWRPSSSQLSGWRHDTHLAGTPENVEAAMFMNSSSLVLGVGKQGRPIVWDVERQKQREQLQPELNYNSEVIEVVTADDRAVSIHRDGSVDAWSLVDGHPLSTTSAPVVDHLGHSPGAAFVDMAIDEASGTLVTSALLPTPEDAPISAVRQWEFCQWNLQTGKMVERWTRAAPTEQAISLADAGKLILYASDTETLLQEPGGSGDIQFSSEDFGSFFGVANPQAENILMLVKRSGAVRVIDATDPSRSWEQESNQLDKANRDRLTADDDVPLIGQWSPAGDRFYMVWSSGRTTEIVWDRSRLYVKRDLMPEELKTLGISWVLSDDAKSEIRLGSRGRIDLKVRQQGAFNVLYVAVRFPGADGRTGLARLVVPQAEGKVMVSAIEKNVGRYQLVLNDEETPEFDAELLNGLPIQSRDVAATESIGKNTYFATVSGTVYQVAQDGGLQVLGRPPVVLDASGNAAADRIAALHEGGLMSRADFADGKWDWTSVKLPAGQYNQISMSPSGDRILLTAGSDAGQPQLTLVDATTGKELESIAGGVCGVWGSADEFSVVLADGTVEVHGAGGAQALGKLADPDARAVSLHYFTEAWSNKPSTTWLVVLTHQTDGTAAVQYFDKAQPQNNQTQRVYKLSTATTHLACSPTEGILVTGGNGIITVRFASPTLGEFGKELFSLEGHAGAEIRCIEFTEDGQTLITGDSQNRLFAWLSEDVLNGISNPVQAQPEQVALH